MKIIIIVLGIGLLVSVILNFHQLKIQEYSNHCEKVNEAVIEILDKKAFE